MSIGFVRYSRGAALAQPRDASLARGRARRGPAVEQLGEACDRHVGVPAVGVVAVDGDDESDSRRARRREACGGRLVGGDVRRLDAEQPARGEQGVRRRLRRQVLELIVTPSTRCSTSSARPEWRRIVVVFALAETTARWIPACRAASRYRRAPT